MYCTHLVQGFKALENFIDNYINPSRYKIISITQHERNYTIVYQV